MNNKTTNVRYLAQLALLAAIEVVMKLMGLGSVPVGPLYMSFLTVPIAVGAIVLGPLASTILGGVFGFVSFMDAIKVRSVPQKGTTVTLKKRISTRMGEKK